MSSLTSALAEIRPYIIEPAVYQSLERGELNEKWVTWTRGTAIDSILRIVDEKMKILALGTLGFENFAKSSSSANFGSGDLNVRSQPFNTADFAKCVKSEVEKYSKRNIDGRLDSDDQIFQLTNILGVPLVLLKKSSDPKNSFTVISQFEQRFRNDEDPDLQEERDINRLIMAQSFLVLSNHEHPKYSVPDSPRFGLTCDLL